MFTGRLPVRAAVEGADHLDLARGRGRRAEAELEVEDVDDAVESVRTVQPERPKPLRLCVLLLAGVT